MVYCVGYLTAYLWDIEDEIANHVTSRHGEPRGYRARLRSRARADSVTTREFLAPNICDSDIYG